MRLGLLCDPERARMSDQTGEPRSVRRVLRHLTVQIRRTVAPPGRPAFPELMLGGIHPTPRSLLGAFVASPFGHANVSTRGHQLFCEIGATVGVEGWISRTPEAAADNEIATIRRHRMLHTAKDSLN